MCDKGSDWGGSYDALGIIESNVHPAVFTRWWSSLVIQDKSALEFYFIFLKKNINTFVCSSLSCILWFLYLVYIIDLSVTWKLVAELCNQVLNISLQFLSCCLTLTLTQYTYFYLNFLPETDNWVLINFCFLSMTVFSQHVFFFSCLPFFQALGSSPTIVAFALGIQSKVISKIFKFH